MNMLLSSPFLHPLGRAFGTIFLATTNVKVLASFSGKNKLLVFNTFLHGFIKRSDMVSDHKIAQNTSFQKNLTLRNILFPGIKADTFDIK